MRIHVYLRFSGPQDTLEHPSSFDINFNSVFMGTYEGDLAHELLFRRSMMVQAYLRGL